MIKLLKTVVGFILLLLASFSAFALDDSQRKVLRMAYEAGKPFDLQQATMGIVYQESMAGHMQPVGDVINGCGKRSYGVAQVQVSAAYDALRVCPYLDEALHTEEEIIARLLTDDEWSVKVAACYLFWINRQGISWYGTIASYNRGVSGYQAGEYDPNYVQSVLYHIRQGKVKRFIQEEGLE